MFNDLVFSWFDLSADDGEWKFYDYVLRLATLDAGTLDDADIEGINDLLVHPSLDITFGDLRNHQFQRIGLNNRSSDTLLT